MSDGGREGVAVLGVVVVVAAVVAVFQQVQMSTLRTAVSDLQEQAETDRRKRSLDTDADAMVRLLDEVTSWSREQHHDLRNGSLLTIIRSFVIDEMKKVEADRKGDNGKPCTSTVMPLGGDGSCCAQLEMPQASADTLHILATAGSDVLLPCNATGYPVPTVTWSPNPVTSSRHTMTSAGLRIHGVGVDDEGVYMCDVSNVLGSATLTLHFFVQVAVMVHVSPPAVTLQQNQDLTASCHATGHPLPSVAWTHIPPSLPTSPVTSSNNTAVNTTVVPGVMRESNLTVRDVSTRDNGVYLCQADNGLETVQGRVLVTVKGQPFVTRWPRSQNASRGDNVRLYCDVIGTPTPVITWSYPQGGQPFNGRVLDDGSLLLSAVDDYNSGLYTCTARNSYGSTSLSATLIITVPVQVVVSPRLTSLHNGHTVALSCVLDGDAMTLSWSKLLARLPPHDPRYLLLSATGDLVITDVTPADSGVYVCSTYNHSATASSILFKDTGNLTCDSVFSECGTTDGLTCGGFCPDLCDQGSVSSQGGGRFSLDSAVCTAAALSGVGDEGPGGQVWWQLHPGAKVKVTDTTTATVSDLRSDPPLVAVILDPVTFHPVSPYPGLDTL